MCRVFVMEMGPWTDGESHRRECLSVDPNSTVADLRALVGNTFAKQPDNFQLIHLGNLLKDSDSLEAAGVNPGSIVLLYSKRDIVNTSQSAEGDPQKNKEKIIASIKELLKRKALHVIGKTDVQMHLLRSIPHLQCSTIALLLSERLLKKWIQDKKQEALDKVAREHPSLGDALEIALQLVLTQGVCVVPKQSGNAYSVDALSDDSDDEVDIHGFHQQQMQQRPGGSRIQSSGMRTPGQQTARGAITNEMLQAALQAAYSEQTQVAARNFGPQLAAMREMGLCDERACIQALVRTGGDVDMAVDLLLSE